MIPTPKPVLTYAATGGGVATPILLDYYGVVQVSPPQLITVEPGAGLTLGIEAQALLLNALEISYTFTTTKPAGLLTVSNITSQDFTSGNLTSAVSTDSTVDGFSGVNSGNLCVFSQSYAWNGASYDRVRIANVFHTALVTAAGTTAVWTPTAGTKFRLMGYSIDIAGTAAATGVQAIELLDGATVIKNHLAVVLQTFAATTAIQGVTISVNCGQGQLSAAANNVLNIHTSEAMVSGGVAINVWGTEE